MKQWQALGGGLVGLGVLAAVSCSPSAFQSETVVDSVRILASRASEPRAKPGDTIELEVLAVDGRKDAPAPPKPGAMAVSWLGAPCVNPAGDAYFACFSKLASGFSGSSGDAGSFAGGGDAGIGIGSLKPGEDLTPFLVSGPTLSFKMPAGIIIPRTGVSPSYGLVILFNFACAGTLKLLAIDPNSANPQAIPVGCFDDNNQQLGADDFVFGFTRLYAYDMPTETNPTITAVDVGGTLLGVDGGVTTAPFVAPLCTNSVSDTCQQKHPIGPVVPASEPSGKQVWVDFFSTIGKFTSNARLLYGPMVDLKIPGDTDDNFLPPSDLTNAPADNYIWMVVHDDQGGADWVKVALQIKGGAAKDGGTDGGR
jgi:hypothetical protein